MTTRLASEPVARIGAGAGRTLVMGVVNATPDSFSDGGRFLETRRAVEHGLRLLSEGADLLDVGGESTRPGALAVPPDEELARIIPVIEGLRERTDAPISVDTRRPQIARAAVAAGASIWNDVAGLAGAPDSLATAAELGCGVVIMHMQGEPPTMQHAPRYGDVVAEVSGWLAARARSAIEAGVRRERVWLDPGIGFGKTLAHNLALIAHLDRLAALGFPLLLGASRKGMIRGLDPTAADPLDRLGGSLALALAGARAGCAAVRVHDVRETVQAIRVQDAIDGARG